MTLTQAQVEEFANDPLLTPYTREANEAFIQRIATEAARIEREALDANAAEIMRLQGDLSEACEARKRAEDERDTNTRRWHLLLQDLWANVDPGPLPEDLCKRVEETLTTGCVKDCGTCERAEAAEDERDRLREALMAVQSDTPQDVPKLLRFNTAVVSQVLDALESDATLEMRRDAFDALRDLVFPIPPAEPQVAEPPRGEEPVSQTLRQDFTPDAKTLRQAWLIERGQAMNHTPTIWWKGGDTRPIDDWPRCWTTTANEARRFPTRAEAAAIAGRLFGYENAPTFTITEHVFLPAPSPDSALLDEAWAKEAAIDIQCAYNLPPEKIADLMGIILAARRTGRS